MDRVARVADHQRRRLERLARRCGRARCGRTGSPGARRRSAPGSWDSAVQPQLEQERDAARGAPPGRPRATTFITGSPKVSANSSGVNAAAQAGIALSSTGISMIIPRSRSGAERGHLERDVGPQRGAADDRLLELEVVEQRHRLPGERGHRVAPHLPRPIGGAVAERVERDHPVARAWPACGPAASASSARAAARASAPWSAVPRRGPCRPAAARRSGNAPCARIPACLPVLTTMPWAVTADRDATVAVHNSTRRIVSWPKSPRSLAGSVVAITGGARGIGRATAAALIAQGARVAIGDIEASLAEQTADELGAGTIGLPLDVTDRASFATFLDEVENRLGPLDVLINNAGIMPIGPLRRGDRRHREADDRHQPPRRDLSAPSSRSSASSRAAAATSSRSPRPPARWASPAAPPTAPPSTRSSVSARRIRAELREHRRRHQRGHAGRRQHRARLGPARDARVQGGPSPRTSPSAIVEALQTGRFEVYVPKSMAGMVRFARSDAAPRHGGHGQLLKGDQVLAHPDHSARAAYEARMARRRCTGARGGRLRGQRPVDGVPDDAPRAASRRPGARPECAEPPNDARPSRLS